MATAPSVDNRPRAQAVEAVLRPLLELFEAASGERAAFFVEVEDGSLAARYAYARDGGVVETRLPAVSPPRPASAASAGLRACAPLPRARGRLEAASLSGRPFDAAAHAALEACAQLLDAHLGEAATGPRASASAAGMALVDAATGLPNRAALVSELERMLARAQRDDMTVFAVCVGLSGLDDLAGAPLFEQQVGALAACLAESVRGGDLVARTGLHEFAVVGTIPRATAEASAAVVLERLHGRCARVAAPASPRARIDMGFAIARIGAFDPQALLAEAEESLLD